MSWLDLAGAALNIGGSIYNSSRQKKASESASNSLVQGNNAALDLQRAIHRAGDRCINRCYLRYRSCTTSNSG